MIRMIRHCKCLVFSNKGIGGVNLPISPTGDRNLCFPTTSKSNPLFRELGLNVRKFFGGASA